jgi:DNA invertase Pin-like site-specific DNA recombinase
MGKGLPVKNKTAALYARFSSDMQKDRSIDDQLVLCRALAERESLKVVATYNDRAKSAATLFDRDELLELMTAAKKKKFDVVIVESLDRLARDQEDLPYLYKRLEFLGVKILTHNEGWATPMHIGIRGLVGSMFLKDLGDKVRRGQMGRVREGRFPGGVTYGYRKVPGKPGEREIDPEQAKIVRRIFRMYADGMSPRYIALKLTQEKIPTPGGAPTWHFSSFVGKGKSGGILMNRLYLGEIIWNTARTILNPDTGRKLKRRTPKEEHIHTAVPHLQIIDQTLWDRAAKVRSDRSAALFGEVRTCSRRPAIPRSNQLLLELLRCGQCGGPMRINSTSNKGVPLVACATAHQRDTCSNRKCYNLLKLQRGVIEGIRKHLGDPVAIAEAAKAYHARYAERMKQNRGDAAELRKQLNRVEVQIGRLVAAIDSAEDITPPQELMALLKQRHTERYGLQERLRLIEAETNVVDLHPAAIDAYRINVEKLHKELVRDPTTPQARTALHALLDSIVVHPTPRWAPYEFTPYGRLSAIMGVDLFPSIPSDKELLQEHGLSKCDNVGSAFSDPTKSHSGKVVSFGRWRTKKAA